MKKTLRQIVKIVEENLKTFFTHELGVGKDSPSISQKPEP